MKKICFYFEASDFQLLRNKFVLNFVFCVYRKKSSMTFDLNLSNITVRNGKCNYSELTNNSYGNKYILIHIETNYMLQTEIVQNSLFAIIWLKYVRERVKTKI